ncbi:MAG: ribonuclease HII [Candidatus Methanomethylicia archaeon]|nr:ribonuclease HII [Candidatus Methanomethylicia archaeon]MCX8169221.1 ribonuclease HII [Candidatus Methanomethylicia archaeon]MDW7988997.1 ribonuclease HII [Nitrososphaerota archaeon]
MMIAGVDEAGRGPIIGPMIIAGVKIKEEDQEKLIRIGVKDSKVLTSKKRQKLCLKIIELCVDYVYEIITPKEIDQAVFYKRRTGIGVLNELEAKAMAKVINKMKPDVVYVDSVDVNENRFKRMIIEKLEYKIEVIARHKADAIYPVVSAASIMAKVKRDSIIEEIKRIYGDIGSGYPSDMKTIRFIKECIKSGELPDFVRKSWSTIKRIKMD